MSKWSKVLVTVAGTALAIGVAMAPAAAQANEPLPTKVYQKAMRGLLADVEGWNGELNVQLNALQTKPEVACGADYHELVQRGGWLAADLAGTAMGGPESLVAPGVDAAEALRQVANGAGIAALDCDGTNVAAALEQVDAGRASYAESIAPVRVFTVGFKYR